MPDADPYEKTDQDDQKPAYEEAIPLSPAEIAKRVQHLKGHATFERQLTTRMMIDKIFAIDALSDLPATCAAIRQNQIAQYRIDPVPDVPYYLVDDGEGLTGRLWFLGEEPWDLYIEGQASKMGIPVRARALFSFRLQDADPGFAYGQGFCYLKIENVLLDAIGRWLEGTVGQSLDRRLGKLLQCVELLAENKGYTR